MHPQKTFFIFFTYNHNNNNFQGYMQNKDAINIHAKPYLALHIIKM